ncbi:3-ketodihydrosphingosine reductase-like isoform X1 [Thamnophis elegans]|uniref:3-ketodihydrosphingosine reductase-like isoform X1 n=1 Tax=Thamnophis elegans TaxID=35005 RepID=UPI001377B383|nr:3-ketodihydrosphingosine reductase-like isoform X1 [Thamnophis elegans]
MPGAVLLAAAGAALLAAFLLLLRYLVSPLRHPKPLSLSGAHVVVTGGSSGIGKSIAIECFKQGAFVTLIARNEKRLLEAKKEIETFSVNDKQVVHSISLDVSKDYANVEKLLKQAQERLGPVDMLVNCAGTSITGKFEEIDTCRFEQLMAINYLGSVYPTRAVVGKMKERRMGRIVFVSSQAGQIGLYGYSAYSATKYALRGLAESLNMEVKPYNIGLTIAYPPDTDTPGYAEESQNKLLETKLISEATSICQPDHVAKIIVKDAVQGKFTSSVGANGHMLTILTNGMAPVSSIAELLESVMFLGVFRLVSLYFTAGFDSIVRRCMIEKEKSEKTD